MEANRGPRKKKNGIMVVKGLHARLCSLTVKTIDANADTDLL